MLNVYATVNELLLSSRNIDDRIDVILNVSGNVRSANGNRTVIDHDDLIIIKSLNVKNVPRDQLLHSKLIIVKQLLIVKASVSLYVCLPIIQGIYNSLEVVDACKRIKLFILTLDLRLQSILVGDVLLKVIAKIRDICHSIFLSQNCIHVNLAVLDDLIGINKRLQLGNREVCIGQNSLFQLCNVHIVQQLALIHVLYDQIGGDVAVLQEILCVNIGLQSGDSLDQIGKLCGIHVCKQRRNIHVLRQRIKTDRLNDLVQLEHLQPLVARNDVEQILHGESLAQCCHINRDARLQALKQIGRNTVALQDRRQRSRVQSERHFRAVVAVDLGVHICPFVSGEHTHRQYRHEREQRQDQGKNLVENLHNKTSLLLEIPPLRRLALFVGLSFVPILAFKKGKISPKVQKYLYLII